MKYFRKSFLRYVAMGLAIAFVSFILGKCDVYASSQTTDFISVKGYNSDGARPLYSTTATTKIRGGYDMYSFSSSFDRSDGQTWNPGIETFILLKTQNTTISGFYNMGFILWSNNYIPYNVTVNGSPCTLNTPLVDNRSDLQSSIVLWSVVCDSVRIYYDSAIEFDVGWYQRSASGSSGDFGIGSRLFINENSTYFDSALLREAQDINSKISVSNQEMEQIQEKQKETNEKIDKTNENVKKVDDTINNSDVEDSTSSATGFFNDFESSDYGFSDIIKMPLTFINGLTSSSCSNLVLPLPFVDKNVTLPCMTSIYQEHFGTFLTIYQTITFGVVAYWVCINLFAMVKGFKDPDSDKVEVFDL